MVILALIVDFVLALVGLDLAAVSVSSQSGPVHYRERIEHGWKTVRLQLAVG